MSSHKQHDATEIDFDEAARRYCKRLPLEHFMESVGQSTQRKITDVALDLVHVPRPDVQGFGELLIQWIRKGRRKLGQVVPDNMVVLWKEPIQAEGSYNIPKQPVGPFWVLEYVSKNNKRKDYEDSFKKYEKELKVPYYLMYYPDEEELTLYRHNGKKYVSVKPNDDGRLDIPELELEIGLLEGWARFWFQGKLIPLPADLQRELDEVRKELNQMRKDRDQAHKDRDEARKDRDEARTALQKVNEEREKERLAFERELEHLRAQLKRNTP